MRKLNTHSRITEAEAVAFKKRWEMVNAFEKKGVRALPANEKLGQLATLRHWLKSLGGLKHWRERQARYESDGIN